ncbi:radical SAM/SPASM domain-containing protein [Helicobacter himalayensis]|uniref:radical SAM/SPASM domain-containing protein n=1 Tax=Helicobacter himalayensis TaxID=1591088 RepID=UPI00082D4849|nr:radical SAM protein [Helicobacter himalayensis]
MKLKRNQTELTGIFGIEKLEILKAYKDPVKWHSYRDTYSQASHLQTITQYPLQIDFELNATCNLKCPMCPLSVEVNSEKKSLLFPFELFCKIIDDGVSKGLRAIKLNYLNEPLLRKDLEKFIQYAKKKGVLDIYFSTNGLLLDSFRAQSLIEAGLDRIQVSIDAFSKEVYDKVRPGGNYKKVVENVLNLVKLKQEMGGGYLPLVRVNFVRTELNEHQLEDFINFWEEKVDMIGSQEMVKPPKSSKDLGSKTTAKKEGFSCSFPYKQLVITAEGNVLPCCTFWGESMVLGNIFTQYEETGSVSMQNFWNSEQMCQLRDLHKKGEYRKNPICKKCIEGALIE